MSTRSCLAYKTKKGFTGVYCHFDGYPTARGKEIWAILMKDFVLNKGKLGISNDGKRSLQSFVDVYIKGHPGGWSSFPKECYCHSAEFVMRDGVRESIIDETCPDALFIEWLYVIDVEAKKMLIYAGGRAEGQIEKKGRDDKPYFTPNYKHYLVRIIKITPDAGEPNWKEIEKRGDAISTDMYNKFSK